MQLGNALFLDVEVLIRMENLSKYVFVFFPCKSQRDQPYRYVTRDKDSKKNKRKKSFIKNLPIKRLFYQFLHKTAKFYVFWKIELEDKQLILLIIR